jgi:ParB family chromosome partitioning protein
VTKRRGGLGSGLGALLPTSSPTQAIRDIEVASISPNRSQPRTVFNEQALNELADSIREHGIIQPLIVISRPEGGYELVAGERRWRAAQLAGLERVPALVRDVANDRMLELALVENIQRADLNPIEEGLAYEALKKEFQLTDEEIAQRVGKGRVTVTNARRLLGLIPEAQQLLLDGQLTAGHGRAILMLEDPEQQQLLLETVRAQELSVRAAEKLASLAASRQLADSIRRALLQGTITAGHAQTLMRLSNQEDQTALLEMILIDGLGVQESERLSEMVLSGIPAAQARRSLRPLGNPSSSEPRNSEKRLPEHQLSAESSAQRGLNPDDAEVVRLFEQALSTPVQLHRSAQGISLTFRFFDDEQLRSFYDLLMGEQED